VCWDEVFDTVSFEKRGEDAVGEGYALGGEGEESGEL